MSDLFAAVDALLAKASALPPPAERARLRQAHGLTQQEVAQALGVRRPTVVGWETGKAEPRPPQREAYARLLEGLAALYPPPGAAPAPSAQPAAPSAPETAPGPAEQPPARTRAHTRAHVEDPPPAPGDDDEEELQPDPVPPTAPASDSEPGSRSRSATRATAPTPAPPEAEPKFTDGPLLVLDGDGHAYGLGGLVLDCPAKTVPALVEWALAQDLGAPRLHRAGKDADPLLILTAPAAARLGLPERLEDRRNLRLPEGHPVLKQLDKAGWQLTKRGFGPWPRVYRPVKDGQRKCVQLAVLPWDALDARAWGNAAALAPADLAHVLGTYAARVLTPRGSSAVTGLELMTALRPPTRAVQDDSGVWVSGPMPGSLTRPVDPAPPEAPSEHPIAQDREPGAVLDEEAYDWTRDPQQLTDQECAWPHAVGLDVNAAFLAAASRLTVGLGPAVHVKAPRFDKRTPGAWLVDLSGLDLDPRLPSPFTHTGERPTGPAWYATPTVAYAEELGHHAEPVEAWLRPEAGPYLDPWYKQLRDAYMATMADLGVTAGMDDAAFLAAMQDHKQSDPGMAMVLSAIKATVKGGIGKLRERPQGAGYRPGERWPALERPTWRPDIRAAVIANARISMHRKMMKMAGAGRFPLAVLSDCVVYPSPSPSPLDLLPRTPDGKNLPGTFRLGASPGMVKLEGVKDMLWAVDLLENGHNPARHIKGDGATDDE
jgi:transcriptional regulator with XRE-family HTH domain